MSDFGGYTALFNQRPDHWLADGYVTIIDGSGTPSYTNNTLPFQTDIVKSVVRNSTGNYSFTLSQAPKALCWVDVKSVIPSGLSPSTVGCQIQGWTVGTLSIATPTITVQFNVSGTPTDLPNGSGFVFAITLVES